MTTMPERVPNAQIRIDNGVAPERLPKAGFDAFVTVDEPEPKRYALVQEDSGGDWYVIEADRRDEWYSTDLTDALHAGDLPWAHMVGGAESQVTFTDPEIFDEPIVDVPA
jgi:hypothetical protein